MAAMAMTTGYDCVRRALLLLGLCLAFALAPPVYAADTPDTDTKTIVFLGDSLTAGYGVGKEAAYPTLLEARLQERGWSYRVTNAGVSGDTTAGGLRRLGWIMKRPVDILVICLGGNDGLRGLSLEASQANLEAIIDAARKRNPDIRILLAGMQMPPNMGETYTDAFRAMYPAVAKAKSVALLPFILEGVGGVDAMNQPDGIHPTEEGHALMLETVWTALLPLLPEAADEAEAEADGAGE